MSAANNNQPSVAIIGFGVAAMNAAIALRTHGFHGEINVFAETAGTPISPILTSYYAGGKRTLDECHPWSAAEIDALNLTVHEQCPVTRLDAAEHVVECAEGTFRFDKCLIASGSRPQLAGFPASDGATPLVLRSLDDAQRLKDALESPACKRVAVCGSSMVALKAVEACLDQGVHATLIARGAHVLRRTGLEAAVERLEQRMRDQGVELLLGTTVQAAEATPGAPAPDAMTLTLSDGSRASFDAVVVAYGMRPNLDFLGAAAGEGAASADTATADAASAGTASAGADATSHAAAPTTYASGLAVDNFMRTEFPDVFAAGDVVKTHNLITGEPAIMATWKNAALQGACAGTAMAAELAGEAPNPEDSFASSFPANTISVGEALFISAGETRLSDNRHVEVEHEDHMTVAMLFETRDNSRKVLRGFNVACDFDEPGGRAYDTAAMLTMRIQADLA